MTHTFDEQLKRILDSLTERMHADFADIVSSTATQLTDAVSVERKAVADEVTASTEASVTARLQEAFAATEDRIRESARAEWFEAGLQQARADHVKAEEAREAEVRQLLEAKDAEARRALQSLEAELRQSVEARENEVRKILEAREAELRRTVDARDAELRRLGEAREAEARSAQARETELKQLLETREVEARKAAEVREVEVRQLLEMRESRARATLDAANQSAALAASQAAAHAAMLRAEAVSKAEFRVLETVLDAMRSLDNASSLTQALECLMTATKPQSDRVALFLLRGDTLRAWSHSGFAAMNDFGAQTDIGLAHGGVLADAVRSSSAQRIAGNDTRRPAFARESNAGVLVAVPLLLNGQVAGVLCGEQLSSPDEGRRLLALYEVVTRHATRVLESLTALRLAHVNAQTAVPAPH